MPVRTVNPLIFYDDAGESVELPAKLPAETM